VDFALRERILGDLQERDDEELGSLVRDLLRNWHDGRIKLWVTHKALRFRREQRDLLLLGDYLPLWAAGARGGQVCAFARRRGDNWAVAVAPRWLTRTGPAEAPDWDASVWSTTRLALPAEAPEHWYNVLTGQRVTAAEDEQGQSVLALDDVFGPCPVALLGRWED
jgi:(1->4)-alpha-D-glucan 1-alpha-D-glucosylmutase